MAGYFVEKPEYYIFSALVALRREKKFFKSVYKSKIICYNSVMDDEKQTIENTVPDDSAVKVPMRVDRGELSASGNPHEIPHDIMYAPEDAYLTDDKTRDVAEPRHVTEIHDDEEDDRMSGGYASVKGSKRSENRIVWIVLIVMTVICIAVGVCSSVLTGHFMRRGMTLPAINVEGDIQQNITAVVTTRKPAVAEISCGGLRGSGVAMKRESGKVYVLTNAHMLQTSHSPSLRFDGDDSFYAGEVLGYNEYYDVAVITVVHDDVYVLGEENFDPTAEYKEGDYVVAIGNAMGMGIAAYDGIVSRSYEVLKYNSKHVPVLRTTAAINAGMSGGALFDMNGNMIGLNTYRMASTVEGSVDHKSSEDVEDTGFVMPVSVVYPIYKQILDYGDGGEIGLLDMRCFSSTNTSITGGIIFVDLGFTAEYRGGMLTVTSIDGSNAPRNLAVGDVIYAVGSYKVTDDLCKTAGEFLHYKKNAITGAKLRLTIKRGNDSFSAEYADIFRYVP